MADRIVKPDTGNDLVLQNDDASAKIEINEAGTIVHTGTSSIDVSGGTFTTSSAQKQAIVQAGPGSGTLDVSSGTFTTSSAQKQAIVQAGPGSGTLDVSSGTFTTSTAQKQAIVQAGPGSGTLDVSSGTFTTSTAQKTAILAGGDFPTDSVVQVQFATASSQLHNTTYTSMEVISKSITPKFSDSKIILSANISGGYNAGLNTGITMFYQIDSATEVFVTDMAVYHTNSEAAGNNISICLVFDASNTTARTYRLRFRRRDSGGGEAYVMFNNSLSAMFLMEVKQ